APVHASDLRRSRQRAGPRAAGGAVRGVAELHELAGGHRLAGLRCSAGGCRGGDHRARARRRHADQPGPGARLAGDPRRLLPRRGRRPRLRGRAGGADAEHRVRLRRGPSGRRLSRRGRPL
ncbi:MAG: hypothetical protein AVDCRST_MAG67-1920, partial [uncultured Solirubrobacteraceae bacterium]